MVSLKTHAGQGEPLVLSAAQMQALEKQAMDAGIVTGLTLMERAGQGVLDAMADHWPDALETPGTACILCGPGNNGGDGYVIARLLKGRGHDVRVVAFGKTTGLPADAQANHDAWAESGTVGNWADAGSAMAGCDLVIDAVFGIGLTRPLGPELADVMVQVPLSARRVAVDVPSGVLADGESPGADPAFPAKLAVTFHCLKPVHLALRDSGVAVAVADIGL